MYEQFFGFSHTPFTKNINPVQLYPSMAQQELLARLYYMVEHRCFGLVIGEVGAGKSTTLRSLYEKLDPAKYLFIYLSDSSLNPRGFYRDLCRRMGLEPAFLKSDAKRQFQTAVMECFQSQKKTPVVAIDEAHLLDHRMLEEVRFLTNFQMDTLSPMTLILMGQPELLKTLSLSAFEAINQRIDIRFHLMGLSEEETRSYIQHHLKTAGCHNAVFTEEAMKLIHQYARGIPRKINNICTSCLLHAFAGSLPLVDDHSVKRVLMTEFKTA
ncbi:ATPase AAA [Clostridiales bacterium PH28_bin88]|nr:ATPase AAA [Clostridiales bacterium PH28_bin88]